MGIFSFFKKESVNPKDVDYLANAEALESRGDFAGAIAEYEKMIQIVYVDKPEKNYRHITKKIVGDYVKLPDYDKVYSLWSTQYEPSDYGAKEMHELVKILEAGQRLDLVMQVYDTAGKKLWRNKIEFLIQQKKIPEANALMNELLMSVESNPEISMQTLKDLWFTKSKLCLSLKKWEEANKYLTKLIDKDPHNPEFRKFKDFCMKQVRMS